MSSSEYTPFQNLLISTYSAVNRSGVLEIPLMKRLFLNAYHLYKRWYEDPFYRLGKNHPELFSGGHVLDVGANVGYTAIVFSELVDSGMQVFGFEPDPKNYKEFSELVKQRGLQERIIAEQAAAGAREGEILFWHNKDHHADHRVLTDEFRKSQEILEEDVLHVPVLKLDEFCAEKGIQQDITFMKVDVQGFEVEVCKGASGIFEKNRNIAIVLEYMPFAIRELGFEPRDILTMMTELGFSAFVVEKNGTLHGPKNQAELDEAVKVRGYVELLFRR